MKTVMRILLSVALALVIVAVTVMFYMGSILKGQIEKYGTQILGTPVKVSSVRAVPLSKRLSVYGIEVANPEGFHSPTAFKLKEVHIELQDGGIFSKNIVFKSINIVNPEITSELSFKGSNVVVLRRNVDHYASKGGKPNAGSETKSPGDGKRVIIKKLTVMDGKVNLAGDISSTVKEVVGVPADKVSTLDFPELVMKNIGEKENGVSASEASFLVMDGVLQNLQFVDQNMMKGAAKGMQNQLRMLMQ